jgi:hypothetical protein
LDRHGGELCLQAGKGVLAAAINRQQQPKAIAYPIASRVEDLMDAVLGEGAVAGQRWRKGRDNMGGLLVRMERDGQDRRGDNANEAQGASRFVLFCIGKHRRLISVGHIFEPIVTWLLVL